MDTNYIQTFIPAADDSPGSSPVRRFQHAHPESLAGRGAARCGCADRSFGFGDGRPERRTCLGARSSRRARARARRVPGRDAGFRAVSQGADEQAGLAVSAQRGHRAAHSSGGDRRIRSRHRPACGVAGRHRHHRHPHRRLLGAVGAAARPPRRRCAGHPGNRCAGTVARPGDVPGHADPPDPGCWPRLREGGGTGRRAVRHAPDRRTGRRDLSRGAAGRRHRMCDDPTQPNL